MIPAKIHIFGLLVYDTKTGVHVLISLLSRWSYMQEEYNFLYAKCSNFAFLGFLRLFRHPLFVVLINIPQSVL